MSFYGNTIAVVPVLIGPIQVLLTLLPAILVAVGATLLSLFKPRVLKQGILLAWRLKVPLVLTVGAIILVGWAAGALWPGGAGPTTAEQAGDDWPVFRGNLRRTGAVSGETGPAAGGVNWTFHGQDEAFFSSPAVVGNRVYVAGAKLGMTSRGGSGRIYCLDADTGAVVWESRPDGYFPTFSSPVVVGDRLLVGEGLHYHNNSRIVCLDRGSGEVIWEYRTGGHVECTPVVSGGRVFVGTGDDGIYAFAVEGDGEGGAKVLWHAPGDEYVDAETSLAAHEGKVYAGLGVGGEALAVLDAGTGQELERLDFDYPVFSPPAIDDGKLYVGMGTGDYVNTAEHYGQRPAGRMVRVDLETLEADWEFSAGDTILGSPALTDDAVYFTSRDGHIYCLQRDGTERWRWNTQSPIIASPAVCDDYVYVVSTTGSLFILDRHDGRRIAQVSLGTEPLFISSPAVARGQVYVGTQNDGLLSVGSRADEPTIPLWPGPGGGPGAGGNPDGSPVPALGEFLWNYPPELAGDGDTTAATPAALLDRLFVPLSGGSNGLAALPPDGDARGGADPLWFYATTNGVRLSPAVRDAEVLLVDGEPGEADRHLHCVDADSGEAKWTLDVADEASGLFTVARDEVFVQDAPRSVAMVDADGTVAWRYEAGELAAAPTVHGAMLLAATIDARLVALDRGTGRLLWLHDLAGRPVGMATADGRTVFVPTTAGVEARSLVDGKMLDDWSLQGGPASADVAVAANEILYINDAGELVVIDREDGSVLHRIDGAMAGTTPMVARGRVLFQGTQRLLLWEIGGEEDPAEWLDVSWLGEPTGGMVLYGSRLYMPRSGWGVVAAGVDDER
ncbi:MAG: PQQ-binding-like beta-propeller repeat protein [Phycisphaerae bacterium]